MNKYITLVAAICIIASLLMGGIAYHFYGKYMATRDEKDNVTLLYSDKIKEVEVYKNSYGNLVHKNEALILENRTVKKLSEEKEFQWLKQFDGLNKRMSNLEFAYKNQIKVTDSLKSKLDFSLRKFVNEQGDTIEFKAFNWKYEDKWSDFKINQITPDSIDFKYSVDVPIDGVFYFKRKIQFNWPPIKKEYFSEIYSENPHVKVTGLQNIKFVKKK